mmetsp:Transcript_12824/g.38739  ORF Transcript_12824/g.38739 Transcript_12824/m.38739 type:complete len:1220 (-) Transcript_12824:544-4203(-)
MAELQKLQELSIISKLTEEIENHTGLAEKSLAEFIFSLSKGSKSVRDFQKQLNENGAEFQESLVHTLWNIIQRLQMKRSGAPAPADGGVTVQSRGGAFSGLAIEDTRDRAKKLEQEILQEGKARTASSAEPSGRSDDGVPPPVNGSGARRSRSRSPSRRHRSRNDDDDRDRRARHDDERDRWRDGDRGRHRGRDRDGRDGGRGGDRDRDSRDHRDGRDGGRARSDRRRDDDMRRGSSARNMPPPPMMDDSPQQHKVYRGKVSNVMDFGAFVELQGMRQRAEGLVHVSEISKTRANSAREVLNRGQECWVKVMRVSTVGGKQQLSLSMRDVDQVTGQDLLPSVNAGLAGDGRSNPSMPAGGPNEMSALHGLSGLSKQSLDTAEEAGTKRRPGKRITSPEKWEINQLIKAGVLDVTEYPTFDAEDGHGILNFDDDNEEEFEIDINDAEPAFLAGQSSRSGVEVSPIKIVKNPDGSMQRAAMTQSALAKERRELKEQQQRTLLEAIPKDLSRPWEDPLPEAGERHLAQELRGVGLAGFEQPEWKTAALGKAPTYGIADSRSIKEQRESLPIFRFRDELLSAIHDNQFLVVIGETGSGKTTQMTQYLAEAGYTSRGKIGCTQPRRVAAMSVAKRVAEEYGCRLGEEVGYCIRFEDQTGPETVIKYMTDGMLLRECLLDDNMSAYSVIILDEAHERTIHTDVLFGLLKGVAARRKDLKLIVTSATLDAEKFSQYFNKCNMFRIPGRTFPVEVLYTKSPESDYMDAALITVMQIHLTEPEGDILLFLTGQEEIDTACQTLWERMKSLGPSVPELIILPVYSSLPSEMQTRIFEPAPTGQRKVVIATNIAEASLTIDGIYYVVDPGFAKQKVYNPKIGMDSLVVTPISQASAQQRRGRAGRTGPGKCYRLYTEAAFMGEMLPTSVPEIQRSNLGMTCLTLKAMGINDLLAFDFMDPPPPATLVSALETLYNLGALDEEGLLTKLGRKMAEFPLDPPMSKMLIASVDLGCSEEVLTIIGMLNAQNIFYRPREKQSQADQKKAKFFQAEGDHLTLLAVYEAWKASKFSNPWCFENFIQSRSMKRAQDVRKQLMQTMDRYRLDLVSAGRNFNKIRMAVASGFFMHAARKDAQEGYKTIADGTPVFIHPSSALFQRQPDWVIYHELVLTSKEYMREVSAIEPKWLVELAPRFFKAADAHKLSKRKRGERIEPLYDRYADPMAWRLSRRRG